MPKAEPPFATLRRQRLNHIGRGLGPILALLVLASSALSSAAATYARVSAPDGLNLRDGPSTSARVLTLLPFGAQVEITGSQSDGGWYPVNAAGRQGYVDGAYIDLSVPAALKGDAVVTPADGAHLRDAPSLSGNVITTLPAGRVVHIVGDPSGDTWYPVQSTDGSGWVNGAFLQATNPDAQSVTIRWYGNDFDGGVLACGGVFHANDPSVAATNGWPCGTHLKVCAVAHCVAVTVRDRGHMGAGAIDLSAAAFQKLASLDVGALVGTLQVVPDASP